MNAPGYRAVFQLASSKSAYADRLARIANSGSLDWPEVRAAQQSIADQFDAADAAVPSGSSGS